MLEHADLEMLLAWWSGELDETSADDVEEHVFACATCTRRAEALPAIADAVTDLGPAALATGVVTPALVDRLEADGVPLQRFRITPGGSTPCAVAVDSKLLITELELPEEAADALDLIIYARDGSVVHRVADVPLARQAGVAVVSAPAEPFLSTAAGVRYRFSLVRSAAEPEEPPLAHYTLEHEGVLPVR